MKITLHTTTIEDQIIKLWKMIGAQVRLILRF